MNASYSLSYTRLKATSFSATISTNTGRTQPWRAPEKIFGRTPSYPAVSLHGPFKYTCGEARARPSEDPGSGKIVRNKPV
ncbi:hypothetical protein J6590_024414 [Homalodisca vitripennis]|nr:hypothetical protein J6590_024414 [Homalodisca vitripennis]